MTPAEWSDAIPRIRALLDLPWLFGDWLLAAERLDMVDERTAVLNGDPRFDALELAHYAFVADRFEPERRRPMPWAYHDAVARLPAPVADDLLDVAAAEEWALKELRRSVREAMREIR